MQNHRWTLKQGFAIGAGLIAVGLLFELSIGPVDWSLLKYPVNVITLAVLIVSIIGMHLLQRRVHAFSFLGTLQAAIPTLCYAVVLTIIMGLTRQTADGQWLHNMLTFWPFVLIYTLVAVILGLVVVKELSHFTLRRLWPLLFHLGLFIALTTATLGSVDMQRMKMTTTIGEAEWRAVDQQGNIRELPLSIQLKRFIMEQYDDGSPRRFASDIQILTKSGKDMLCTVDVNKPVAVEGWKIYQYSYDTQLGAMSRISILELVTDPWLPLVYGGIYLMLAGAVCMFLFGGPLKER